MIIVISYPDSFKNEQDIVSQLFDAGLEIFHLRKKELTEKELRIFIEKMPSDSLKNTVLHSHYHLVKEYGLRGIHVPCTHNNEEHTGTVSISFHSFEEIEQNRLSCDYAFLSPVFDSISKDGYKKRFDHKEIKEFLKKRNEKIVALGGIDEVNIEKTKDLGFSGIALMGAIWKSQDPVEKYLRIREKWLS